MTETEVWVAEVNRLSQLVDDYAERHDINKPLESHNYNVLVAAYVAACKGEIPGSYHRKNVRFSEPTR